MCLVFGWLGIATAYENTVQVAYGEYKSAIEITDEQIRILSLYLHNWLLLNIALHIHTPI